MTSRAATVAAAVFFLFGEIASGQGAEAPQPYDGVEVVSINTAKHIVVIRNSKGVQETLDLADGLASSGSVKAGDRVMMTVGDDTGRKRITAITKLVAQPAPGAASQDASIPVSTDAAGGVEIRDRFSNQVATAAQQARSIDALWSSFVARCDAKMLSSADGGHDWFGLWDGRVKADLSGGFCRDLFNQIVSSGEAVKKAMAAAEDVARKTLEPGDIRDIRRLNSMDWEGWGMPPPDKLAP
jgi:hypothetical protein